MKNKIKIFMTILTLTCFVHVAIAGSNTDIELLRVQYIAIDGKSLCVAVKLLGGKIVSNTISNVECKTGQTRENKLKNDMFSLLYKEEVKSYGLSYHNGPLVNNITGEKLTCFHYHPTGFEKS